jgi:hypothetical protein
LFGGVIAHNVTELLSPFYSLCLTFRTVYGVAFAVGFGHGI